MSPPQSSSRAMRSTCRSRTTRSVASSRASSTATSRSPSACGSSPRRAGSAPSSWSSVATAEAGSPAEEWQERVLKDGSRWQVYKRLLHARGSRRGARRRRAPARRALVRRRTVAQRVTRRRSSYRSLASLQRDNRVCRACVEAGYPLESWPVVEGRPGQRAYILGQAPGIVEGEQRRPWRGRAGATLRRWLGVDEDEFYDTFYCASVTRCYPGRAPIGRGDRTPTPAGAGAVRVLARVGAATAATRADRHGRRPRDPPKLLGLSRLAESSARATRSTTRSRSRFPTPRARAAGSTTLRTAPASGRPPRTSAASWRGYERGTSLFTANRRTRRDHPAPAPARQGAMATLAPWLRFRTGARSFACSASCARTSGRSRSRSCSPPGHRSLRSRSIRITQERDRRARSARGDREALWMLVGVDRRRSASSRRC